MLSLLWAVLGAARSPFRTRQELALENLASRLTWEAWREAIAGAGIPVLDVGVRIYVDAPEAMVRAVLRFVSPG